MKDLKELQKLISYHDMEVVENNNKLYICNSGLISSWRITITPLGLFFRKGYQIENDLVISANEIRKEFFDVI